MEDSAMASSPSVVSKPSSKAVHMGLGLLFVSLGAFAFAAYPMYVIRPFREQTPVALERALWVSLHGKPILLLVAVVIMVLALTWWRRARLPLKVVLAPAAVIAILAAAVS